jgi:nicotinate dehydrogenase subunit B
VVVLVVNAVAREVEVTPGRTLLDLLREDLGLTGAKYGCGEGECGACTVLVNGAPARACTVPVESVEGGTVRTVEALAGGGRLHRVQAAFVAARAAQCGYCTPGMLMSAAALLECDPAPDDAAIRTALAGNICRCGGYPAVLRAVHAAAAMDPDVMDADVMDPAPPRAAAASAGRVPVPDRTVWTVVLPAAHEHAGRGWGWSAPGGARLSIDGTGLVTAFTGKVDCGQGNRVALTRLIAAELAVGTSRVELEMGDTASAPLDLGTFGSRSTPDLGPAMRLLAAAARRELIRVAAGRWGIREDRLTAADGAVHDPDRSRMLSYAELVAAGPRTVDVDPLEPVAALSPALAGVDDGRLRAGLVATVTGAKRYPSDLTLPGMRYGAVLRPPGQGQSLSGVDTGAARALPGVTVVRHGDFVGAVAPTRQAATAAVTAMRPRWRATPQPSGTELVEYLRTHPAAGNEWEAAAGTDIGDVDKACAEADICLSASYTTAYIAHVPMECRVALATVDTNGATVWVGTQRPFAVRTAVAEALGLDESRVRVVVPDFGGGFGGKHWPDVAIEAARLARAAAAPVKVCWTREEEFRWAYLRPAAVIDVRAAANLDGTITGWDFTNINSGAAGLSTPYDVANLRERHRAAASPLPQGSYRGLAATANNFARESHLDDLASALRVDAIELRLRQLAQPRLRVTLQALADRVDWPNRPRGDGHGLGVACGFEKDASVATAAEVRVDPDGTLHLLRVVTAFECGAIIDAGGLRNQVVGATVMGLGGALFEAIRFDRGEIANASLTSYRVPRFPDIPPIDVILLDRPGSAPTGAGETPIIAIAPAIANAIHAATGRRLRDLPLAPHGSAGAG